jgi:O-antigen ligase
MFRISTLFIVAGIIEFFFVPDLVFSSPSPSDARRFNIIVPQIGANLLGIVLFVLIAGLITGNFMEEKKFRHIKFFYLAILLLLLYLAHSRIIFTTVILVSYYLAIRTAQGLPFSSSRGTYARISVFWGTLIIINFLVFSESVKVELRDFFTRGQDSRGLSTLTGRTTVWSEALSFGNDKPIFGHGFYSGHRYALGSFSKIIRFHNNLDNTWIETYIDLGILGILLLACLITFTFLRLRNIGSQFSQLSISILFVIVTNSAYNPGITFPSSTLIFFAFLISESREHRIVEHQNTLVPIERY